MSSDSPDNDDDDEVTVWDYPAIDESAAQELIGAQGGSAHLLTARDVGALQNQAHAEADKRGYREGLATGRADVSSRVERLDRLAMALARPLHELDQLIEKELLELAAALARQILHRELEHDPGQIINAVQDCLDVLPNSARDVTVHLCPQDVALVMEHLGGDVERPWRVEEDGALEPGSLRISSDSSQIDGRLHVRLQEIIAASAREPAGTGEAP